MLRVFNQKEDVEANQLFNENRKFTEICLVRSFANSIDNLVVGTDRGQIKVYGTPPFLHTESPFDSFNSHNGEVVKILSSPDGRYVFSAGSDGTLFIYSVTELANETTAMKQEINITTIKEEANTLNNSN